MRLDALVFQDRQTAVQNTKTTWSPSPGKLMQFDILLSTRMGACLCRLATCLLGRGMPEQPRCGRGWCVVEGAWKCNVAKFCQQGETVESRKVDRSEEAESQSN
mmetsp:Transcript_23385/g.36591  ORF Transcript_23385/g.36591 Transcript_23385/m.36591 type:complete len:104 (-) Transcript_23385:875-1186(-)